MNIKNFEKFLLEGIDTEEQETKMLYSIIKNPYGCIKTEIVRMPIINGDICYKINHKISCISKEKNKIFKIKEYHFEDYNKDIQYTNSIKNITKINKFLFKMKNYLLKYY